MCVMAAGVSIDRQSVMNVVPIVGCCVGRIDVERLDRIINCKTRSTWAIRTTATGSHHRA